MEAYAPQFPTLACLLSEFFWYTVKKAHSLRSIFALVVWKAFTVLQKLKCKRTANLSTLVKQLCIAFPQSYSPLLLLGPLVLIIGAPFPALPIMSAIF